ncbi:MAG: cellulase family glycosylhydrolase [Lachnospiraceae bacterium]
MKVRNNLKKLFAGLTAFSLLLAGLPAIESSAAQNTQTVSAQMPFRELTAQEMVSEMGNGWNLGNTMDGHTGFTPSETLWQNVETTQGLIKEIHDMGFNTIRIPVTWGTMIDDENGYAIDEQWMSRVQDIVDYAVNMNMYVIINIHHDGAEQTGWLRIAAEDLEPVKEKYEAVWRHIAERFKDYDEHLIFESMNEVTGDGVVAKDTAIINEFNQIFVDTVRATGSNNAVRWLSVPGRYTNIVNTTNPDNGFKLPQDSVENRLFVAVHYYDWQFGLLETTQTTTFVEQRVDALIDEFWLLEEAFTSKGIPVILGEYGAINKGNTAERAYHLEIVTRLCQQIGIVPCYWDQGWYDLSMTPDFSFTLVDRETYEKVYPEIIDGIMRGLYLTGSEDLKDITTSPAINSIPSLGTVDGTYLLHMGEVVDVVLEDVDKNAYNDIVLWRSADETVATVNIEAGNLDQWEANIHATGIGNTVITAYTQSGSALLEIPIEVQAARTTNPCTEITVEQDSYIMTAGQSLFMNAGMAPADTDAYLTYRSSDPEVVTVSKLGKLVALQGGSAYIIITSSDGLTKVVPVTVEEAEACAEIDLALNVYYNDNNLNYFSNECGSAISVSEDGQYTLEFDCGKDLSSNAITAGVTGLNNLTAIYIKDDSVTKGKTKKSPLISCDIFYDSVIVDGVEFDVIMTEPKSAIKASGILDTNDPINSWDGSVIEEVTVNNHVLNFVGLENPQHVKVTFTISNLVFEEGAGEVQAVTTESMEAGSNAVSVDDSTPAELSVTVKPAGVENITFVSSDASVVSVDNKAVAVNGTASVQVYAHGNGEATVTAYAPDGVTYEFTVTASVSEDRVFANVKHETEGTAGSGDTGSTAAGDTVTEGTPDEGGTSNGTLSTVLLVLGVILLGAAAFFGSMKVAGGSGKKEEKK